MRPVRAAWTAVTGPQEDPLAAFQRQERAAVIAAVEKMLDELQRLAQVGNDILQPRLRRILGGPARAELLARIEAETSRAAAGGRGLSGDAPRRAGRLAGRPSAGRALAAPRLTRPRPRRPAITVTLAVSGWVFAGDVVGQAAMHVAGNLAGHVASEVVVAGGGEALVAGGGEGLRQAAARLFRRLQVCFAEKRAGWLADFLETQLLGDLLCELRQGAAVAQSAEFKSVESAIQELEASTEK